MAVYKILTVNASAERAEMISQSIKEFVPGDFTLEPLGNVDSIDAVQSTVAAKTPDIVIVGANYSAEEQATISGLIKAGSPSAKVLALPAAVLAEKGPGGLAEYIKEQWVALVQ